MPLPDRGVTVGPARVTHPLVLKPGAYTATAGLGRAWVQLQGLVRGQRLALPLRGIHWPTGSLRLLRWDDGQVSLHYALDADVAGGTDILGAALSDSAGCGCTAWTELYRPCRAVKRRLRARSGTPDGPVHPGLEPARQLALP